MSTSIEAGSQERSQSTEAEMSNVHVKLLDVQSQMILDCLLTEHTIDTERTKLIQVNEEGFAWFWKRKILLFTRLSMLNIICECI